MRFAAFPGVLLLSLTGCEVARFDAARLGPERLAAIGPTRLTESDLKSTGAAAVIDDIVHAYSVDLGCRPWAVPLEPGLRSTLLYGDEDAATDDDAPADEDLQVDLVGSLRYYALETDNLAPWIEGFGGLSYSDVDLAVTGQDDAVGPVFGAAVGVSGVISQAIAIEVALRYTYSEVELFGTDAETTDLGLAMGLSASF